MDKLSDIGLCLLCLFIGLFVGFICSLIIKMENIRNEEKQKAEKKCLRIVEQVLKERLKDTEKEKED